MISYKALTTASTIIETIDDVNLYESDIFSSNGTILYPYDIDTTLTGVIYKDFKDVTNKFDDIRWSIYNITSNDYEEDKEWNEIHKGKNPITINRDEIDGKALIQFEVYKNFSGIPGDDTLVACSRISLVDTSDLLSSGMKPDNPYIGQVWIDSSTEPATMWMWNGYKWSQVGTVAAMVKNLIRNGGFFSYNYKYFDIVGDEKNSYTPVVKINNGKKWLNLSSDVITDDPRGITQTTDDTENICTNSDYSFQFLVYNNSKDSNEIKINIYSIDSYKKETIIYEDYYIISDSIKSYFCVFKTENNTKNIRVELIGTENKQFNFCITELALYNTINQYPWEPSPYDSEINYDSESIFNALTYDGKIQGIYSMVNPETGQIQYYFNADYIQSGTIKGQYIDAKNLTVTRNDGVKTLEIDSNGNVNLIVSSFKLSATNQTIEDFVTDSLNKMSPEQLKYFLYQIEKDHEQINFEYEQYYNDSNLAPIDYDGPWEEYLDEDMLNRVNEEANPINIMQLKFKANNTVSIKDEGTGKDNSFYLGQAKLGFSKLGINESENIESGKLKKLLYYTHLAYEESFDTLINTIEYLMNKPTQQNIRMLKLSNIEANIEDDYSDYSIKNALLNKIFVLCSDYITNHKITLITDDWADFKLEADRVITEVGQIKSFYDQDTLIGAIGSIANETITSGSIMNKITEGAANPNNQEIIEKFRETIMEQTAGGLGITASDFKNGLETSFKVATDGIFIDANGSLINAQNKVININSENINLSGYVTFENLSSNDGKTIIDGGNIITNSLSGESIITGTLEADKITTGKLQSKDENSIFNLDNGTFKLGNSLTYENGKLSFSGVTITGSDVDINNNLPNWIQSWDNNKTEISGEEIVTPKAFFGIYDPQGAQGLSGIFMGTNLDTRHEAGEEGLIDAGIVGYHCDDVTFRFNLDGTAVFGSSNDRQIKILEDGIMELPVIRGNEISAYNLKVEHKTNKNITFAIDENGNINLKPNEFHLYNGDKEAISLVNGTTVINAESITAGKLSSGILNITDGNFKVNREDTDYITFFIDTNGDVVLDPKEFHLYSTNGSTKYEAISTINGVTNINANSITVGELNGSLIKSNSIETTSLMVSSAVDGINNLTKNALFYKCTSISELDNPTLIDNCTLGKSQYDKYYSYNIDYTGQLIDNTEKVYIQVDLKQFYNVSASKIFFENKSSKNYYYKIKYSLDNIHWHDWIDNNDQWFTTKDNLYDQNKDYTLTINELGVTARYFRLCLNGYEESLSSPVISSLSAWELYSAGSTTCIDANGIITGTLDADRIATNSITTEHININDDGFEFKNGDDTVFAIIGEDSDNCSIIIIPDRFILHGKDNEYGIMLDDNVLDINASYINSGTIKADLIESESITGDKIMANSITGNKINAKGLIVSKTVNEESINTFTVTNDGNVVVNGGSFLITNSFNEDKTVEGMFNDYNDYLNQYIRMEGDTITLGKTTDNASYRTVINSEKLSFMYEQNEVAYVSSQKMYITNTEIKEKLTIGRADEAYYKGGFFDFIHRSNGHLTLKWREK